MHQESNSIIKRIIRSCEFHHNLPAIQNTGQESISYNTLRKSFADNSFKKYFINSKKGLFAFYGEKSISLLQLMLCALNDDNALLPLDIYSPPSRIAFILQNAGVKALLVESKYINAIEIEIRKLSLDYSLISYNTSYSLFVFSLFTEYDEDVSHVLYTSGSTGLPKGVIHTNESTLAFIDWCTSSFRFGNQTTCISIAPFSFDISIMDIYACLISGGKLIIPSGNEVSNSRMMAGIISEYKINSLYSTPTFFKMLIEYGKPEKYNYQQVNQIFIAGEQLFGDVVLAIHQHFPTAQLFNLYGPTETNVCFYHVIDTTAVSATEPVPIGQPCSYAHYTTRKSGDKNELLIAGESVMKNYVSGLSPFIRMNGINYYCTGDLVVQNTSGNWLFAGRKDHQVKRNGFRIELQEIEYCYRSFSKLKDLLITVAEDNSVKINLMYQSSEEISEIELRNFGLQKLPSYMIPDSFKRVESFSVNSNNKKVVK